MNKTVRVGVDEGVHQDLLAGFPAEATIVRIPSHPVEPIDVDFWILPFHRKDAAEVFRMLRGVKVVQSMMAGVDWILPWLPKGVLLSDGRGIHDISASEWVMAAILSSLKRMPLYRDLQTRGEWRGWGKKDEVKAADGAQRGQYLVLGDDLAGKTVLIVGYGSIGQAVEARLAPFGVQIVRLARTARTEPLVHPTDELHALLPIADIVVIIVPMTPETKGLIGATEIALMHQDALLVNAARGPIVITDALVKALDARRIFAALDVTDPEPLPDGHPLWKCPNCLITPHVGGSTSQFIHRAFRFGSEQVTRFVQGKPMENIVGDEGY